MLSPYLFKKALHTDVCLPTAQHQPSRITAKHSQHSGSDAGYQWVSNEPNCMGSEPSVTPVDDSDSFSDEHQPTTSPAPSPPIPIPTPSPRTDLGLATARFEPWWTQLSAGLPARSDQGAQQIQVGMLTNPQRQGYHHKSCATPFPHATAHDFLHESPAPIKTTPRLEAAEDDGLLTRRISHAAARINAWYFGVSERLPPPDLLREFAGDLEDCEVRVSQINEQNAFARNRQNEAEVVASEKYVVLERVISNALKRAYRMMLGGSPEYIQVARTQGVWGGGEAEAGSIC